MFYRRAEGIRYTLRPCDRRQLKAEVPHRGSETLLPRAEAELLARLSGWHTADELGCAPERLQWLVDHDLAYFSPSERRPAHVLGSAPLSHRSGPVALRQNAAPYTVMRRPGEIDLLPFMPRRGSLDGAAAIGVEWRVREHDAEVATVRLVCCRRHEQAARALLPLLDGRHAWDELDAEILDALDLVGLLQCWSPPHWPSQAPQVTWLGHACVLYEAGGKRLIVDPLFPTPSLPPRQAKAPRPTDPRLIGPVDGILITHGDNDHLNAESLLHFATDTPVYLPQSGRKMAFQVDLEGVLRLAGFTDLRPLDEWERVRIGEVTVTAAPFVGEDWGLELPKRTYLIQHPSLTVYLSADSAFMPEVYRRLAAEQPRIDLACLGVGHCAEPFISGREFGYGHFYLEWIPAEKANLWVAHTAGPEESAEAARILGARRAFGYAAGAPWMPMSFSDRGSHAQLAKLLQGSKIEAIDLPPGVPWPIS